LSFSFCLFLFVCFFVCFSSKRAALFPESYFSYSRAILVVLRDSCSIPSLFAFSAPLPPPPGGAGRASSLLILYVVAFSAAV
jgi:hypothetical protein